MSDPGSRIEELKERIEWFEAKAAKFKAAQAGYTDDEFFDWCYATDQIKLAKEELETIEKRGLK